MRLAKLKLWSFKERKIRDDLIEAYKMVHGLSSMKSETFFEVDYDSRTHGHDWKLKKRRSNTRLHLHFFSERVVNWWNGLENTTVCAKSVNSFKSDSSKKNLCCTSDRLVMYCTKNGSRWVCGWPSGKHSGKVRLHWSLNWTQQRITDAGVWHL